MSALDVFAVFLAIPLLVVIFAWLFKDLGDSHRRELRRQRGRGPRIERPRFWIGPPK